MDASPAALPIRLGINFDGRVELLGAKLTPADGFKPGGAVQLTLYWRKLGPVERGYRLFTHVLDAAGERVLNLDAVGPLRKLAGGEPLLPVSAWELGKVYVDPQTFTLPTLRTDTFSIVAGVYRGDERLPVRSGPKLGTRGLVRTARLERPPSRSAATLPQLWIPHVLKGTSMVIDGKLDERAWARAATTGEFVNVRTGEADPAAEVSGSALLLYDATALYVGFEVADADVQGGFDPAKPDPHLWTRDTVEIMIDPDGDGDGRDYYEIQVGPQNLVFDSEFDSENQPRVEPNGPFGHEEWSSEIKSAVVISGTLDAPGEDEGYVVELAIPWRSLRRAKQLPPSPASVWRMNFYAMQNNSGTAWSPILGQGNFHKASRFGRVHFSK